MLSTVEIPVKTNEQENKPAMLFATLYKGSEVTLTPHFKTLQKNESTISDR
jgi:hypothetical protein